MAQHWMRSGWLWKQKNHDHSSKVFISHFTSPEGYWKKTSDIVYAINLCHLSDCKAWVSLSCPCCRTTVFYCFHCDCLIIIINLSPVFIPSMPWSQWFVSQRSTSSPLKTCEWVELKQIQDHNASNSATWGQLLTFQVPTLWASSFKKTAKASQIKDMTDRIIGIIFPLVLPKLKNAL